MKSTTFSLKLGVSAIEISRVLSCICFNFEGSAKSSFVIFFPSSLSNKDQFPQKYFDWLKFQRSWLQNFNQNPQFLLMYFLAAEELLRKDKSLTCSPVSGNNWSTTVLRNSIHFYCIEGYIVLSNIVLNTYSSNFYMWLKQLFSYGLSSEWLAWATALRDR